MNRVAFESGLKIMFNSASENLHINRNCRRVLVLQLSRCKKEVIGKSNYYCRVSHSQYEDIAF